MPPRKSGKLTREEILQKKREAAKVRLNEIKNDPIKLAEYKEKERLKYLKKKEKGQRKSIKSMTPREQRKTRKSWKKYSSDHRKKQQAMNNITNTYMRTNTPPASDDEVDPPVLAENGAPNLNLPRQNIIEHPRQKEARKRSQRQRKLRLKEIKKKDKTISELKSKLNCQRQKYKRLKDKIQKRKSTLTPKTKIEQMAEDPKQKKELVKKALFGEVIQTQILENFSQTKTYSDRSNLKRLIGGKIVDNYKLWRFKNKVMTYKLAGHNKVRSVAKKTKLRVQDIVHSFYEDDSNSRQAAGKKEYVTRNSVKKQKRYLSDSLKNLHKKFLQSGDITIGYALFCRLRPFWVVPPKLSDRDTCACIIHENIDLKLSALYNAKILACSNFQALLQILCCDRYSERCLERICDGCLLKKLPYKEFENSKNILFKQWVHTKESFIDPKTKKERSVMKYKKEAKEMSPRDMILQLEDDLQRFFIHERNIVHQYNAIKSLKKSLTKKDAIIHMDFSENYAAKCKQEIQAFHFGGSRTQISLHTVVVYTKESTVSHCTISSNLSHNAAAIWAHLRPILASLPLTVENLHFLSDGPVTQYRNKTMFFILGCKIEEFYPRIMTFSWNYHEAGHGKGAPDGVGATCKRTADQVVAQRGDITSLPEFVDTLREKCPAINISIIEDADIEKINDLINENQKEMISFKGTLMVHQIVGNMYRSNQLVMKALSCFCDSNACDHYKLGTIEYKKNANRLNPAPIFTDSEDETAQQGISEDLRHKLGVSYSSGDYVLVKFPVRNKEYRYAAICSNFDEDERELTVTFLKVCHDNGTLFKLDENDVADISLEQVIEKLPVPNLSIKGNRVFYKFKEAVNVFEK